jgi:hypothetical protein
VHTGVLTKIYDDVTPYSKFLVGAAVSADKPATLIGFDVSMGSSDNDDIFLYNLSSPAQPTYLFKYILNSYNASRGDLATDVSADLYVGSKFDTDADGWTGAALSVSDISQIVQTIGITYDASGYIGIADTDDYWTTFAAPAKFLGDKSDWLGGTISLDLINQTGGTAINGPVVFLVSGDTVLCSPFILPSGSWLNYQIALTPAGWHLQTIDGVEPDLETMHNVLANLDAMYIVGDYVSGTETTSIDNVGMVSGLSVDSDNSGFVNFVDFAMFAEQWQQELCDTTNWCDGQDFNKSGDVNYSDMQYLVINWLTEIH